MKNGVDLNDIIRPLGRLNDEGIVWIFRIGAGRYKTQMFSGKHLPGGNPVRLDLQRGQGVLLRQPAVAGQRAIARRRVLDGVDDNTEIYDGELESAIKHASKAG